MPRGRKKVEVTVIEPKIEIRYVDKIVERPVISGFALYKLLKESGFAQGGSGMFMQDPDSNEKVYIPLPGEVYTQFLGDPKDWQVLTDAMVRVWLEQHGTTKKETSGR